LATKGHIYSRHSFSCHYAVVKDHPLARGWPTFPARVKYTPLLVACQEHSAMRLDGQDSVAR